MENVKISVIVPAYNAEETLERCIISILQQTYRNIELIIINDGSTDNSGEIVERYYTVDKRIVLINQENAGVSAARNQGIFRATGEWITFVDADDYLEKECLSIAISRARQVRAELVLWNRMDVYRNRMEEKRVFGGMEGGKVLREELIEKVFYNTDGNLEMCSVYCRLFQRELILENNILFDEELIQGEDLVFMLDYLMHTDSAVWCNNATYFRTMRSDSALHQYSPHIGERLTILLDKIAYRMNSMGNEKIRKFYNVYVLRGPVTVYIESFICHRKNKRRRRERAIQLQSFLENERIKVALYGINYKELPINLKIKLFCVRHKVMLVLDIWYRTKKYM